MSPNADRISKNQLKMIGEMLGRSLELMGKVEKETYIAQVAKFSKGARRVFGGIAKDVMIFKDIHRNMTSHPNPVVRTKHLTTWQLYRTQFGPALDALE